MTAGPPSTRLVAEDSLESNKYDSVLFVSSPGQKNIPVVIQKTISDALTCDPSLKTEIAILPVDLPAGRLVYSPIESVDLDYHDVRIIQDAAVAAVKRALKAGFKKPLLVLLENENFESACLVNILATLQTLYTPIQVREHDPTKENKVECLGVFSNNLDQTKKLIQVANILEMGRRVARDIGDADPERMSPPRIEEYVVNHFAGSSIEVKTVSDVDVFAKEYPLFEAVNRAASVQERHRGRILYLTYNPPESARETLLIVGKGVTYDTGGADVKITGFMRGMSRDKCGAAAVAGFMHVVNQLRPKDVKVVAAMCVVRNSIGSNGYVADEVITARSGARVRVINTDAEGRMAMADVLCHMKELALNEVNPHLFTIATLTGHAARTVGEGYSIVMDNGPARRIGNDRKLQEVSEKIGDPIEISTIRREDLIGVKEGTAEGDDIVQCQTKPSGQLARSHQAAAAFLLTASGLDKYGSGSDTPLKYSHLDIAASAGHFPKPATGAPILALAQTYLL